MYIKLFAINIKTCTILVVADIKKANLNKIIGKLTDGVDRNDEDEQGN